MPFVQVRISTLISMIARNSSPESLISPPSQSSMTLMYAWHFDTFGWFHSDWEGVGQWDWWRVNVVEYFIVVVACWIVLNHWACVVSLILPGFMVCLLVCFGVRLFVSYVVCLFVHYEQKWRFVGGKSYINEKKSSFIFGHKPYWTL